MTKVDRKPSRFVSSILATAMVVGQAQAAEAPASPAPSAAMRVTYDTLDQNLNTAFVDIDLVNVCNGKKKCEVTIEEGKTLQIESAGELVPFAAAEGHAADGIVREHAQRADLPANPCVKADGLVITDMVWRTSRAYREYSPGSFKSGKQAFVGVKPSRINYGTYTFKDPVNQFCFSETTVKTKSREFFTVPFSVLSVRVKADFTRTDREVTFAENMKRSTQPLLDRIQESINNAQILLDEEDVLLEFDSVVKDLTLMNATLMAVRSTLRPSAESQLDFTSPADPRVSEPLRLATTIWARSKAGIERLRFEPFRDASGNRLKKTPKLSRKDKKDRSIVTKHYSNESFRRHITWLSDDMEALKSQFPPYPASEDRVLAARVVRLMLSQLSRVRGSGLAQIESKTLTPEASSEFILKVQESLTEAHKFLEQEGSDSANAKSALKELADFWNSDSSQSVIKSWSTEGTPEVKRNLRGFRSLFEPLLATAAGTEIEFENGPLSGLAKADDGQGGRVLCNLDASGEYCWVDLISQCAGRTACSTKLSFNGHWVNALGRTGRLALTEEVTGMALDGADQGTYLPGNTEVCSDLPITAVRYYTKKEDLRWTSHFDGRIMSQQILKDTPPIYPLDEKVKLSEKCIAMDADSKEGSYAILSVKVKLDLDKDRAQMVPRLMLNAGRRLLENTRKTLLMTEGMPKASPTFAALLTNFRAELKGIEKKLDSKYWFDSKQINTPITDPELREQAEKLLLTTQLAQAVVANSLPPTAPLVVHLKGFARELQLGFGFDSETVVKKGRTVTPHHADREAVAFEFDRHVKAWERQLKQGLVLNRMMDPVQKLIASLRVGISELKNTPTDRSGMGTYMLSEGAVKAATKIYEASIALTTEMSRAKAEKYRHDLQALNELRNYLATNFKISVGDLGSATKDIQPKPLLEVMSYAVSVAMESPKLKWINRQYEALETIQAVLKNDLLGGTAVTSETWGALLAAWEAPAAQVALQSTLSGTKTLEILNSALETLNQSSALKSAGRITKIQE